MAPTSGKNQGTVVSHLVNETGSGMLIFRQFFFSHFILLVVKHSRTAAQEQQSRVNGPDQ